MTRSPEGRVKIDCRLTGDWSAQRGAMQALMRPVAKARMMMLMTKGMTALLVPRTA
jgi:hypothetical protein